MLLTNLKTSTICIILLLLTSCGGSNNNDQVLAIISPDNGMTEPAQDNDIPIVNTESTYPVLLNENITYAEGLSHNNSSTVPFALPLSLDIYYPDNSATNRPVFMFIHGGGFTGGIKHKPEIVDMANYYASRGWIFVSIDYRTTEELGQIQEMSTDQVITYYRGIAPQAWIEYALQGVETTKQLQQSIAMYAAQRDAKAALRWIIANATNYGVNTDFITVGGASAGAISTIALGISNQEDFRDEISSVDDPTLITTHLNENYSVKSMVYFWGSNIKLELFESVYGLNRYDSNDPELFMAHGTNDQNPTTSFSEATELQELYYLSNVHNELVALEGEGHGAWHAKVDDKGLFEMSFEFIVARQYLQLQ